MTNTAENIMSSSTPATVPLEVFQREHEKRLQAEHDRDYWKNEFYLARNLRRAPVLKPVAKEILQEFRHVEKWGKVKDASDRTRANFKTIASNLKTTPETIARHAERLEKLGLVEIHEHLGPEDECERKYVHVKEEKLSHINELEDPDHVIPKQGGNRYICPKCDSTNVSIKKVTWLHCDDCHHEEVIDDTGWIMQIGHKKQKTQKQLAFQKSKHTQESEPLPENHLASHSVDTLPIDTPQVEQKQDASILPELKKRRIWACYRLVWNEEKGKFDKVPYIANLQGEQKASTTNPSTWRTYEYAVSCYEQSQGWTDPSSPPFDGIGFMCDGTFTFMDQDHCRSKETGEIDPDAMERAMRINSYTEPSVSGDGIHTYAWDTLPPGRRRSDAIGVEMYDNARFCVFTGKPLPDFPQTMEHRKDELQALHSELFPEQPKLEPLWNNDADTPCSQPDEKILEQAMHARNGSGAKFTRLWNGDASEYRHKDGSIDQSSADFALCRLLAYWTNNSVSTIDRLFRQSGLMRDKWDEPARSGELYGQGTIIRALCPQREDLAS